MIGEIAGTAAPGAGPSLRMLGRQLRKRVWDPLATRIDGTTRVFVVPDGALNLVPIGALPADKGGYVIEQLPVIHYLSAERDVARSEEPLRASSGLLAIGGPAFEDGSSFAALSGSNSQYARRALAGSGANAASARSERQLRGTESACPSFRSIRFTALPGAKNEAEIIARLWDRIGLETPSGPDHVRLLTGGLATERAFKELSPKRRILHLATHGFFLADECGAVLEETRSVGGVVPVKSVNVRPNVDGPRRLSDVVENPLLLSGLALAGANRRAAASLEEDDGILTAEEVAALNLEGVEWAVLSACDTGRGTVAAGEGVLGLRRAFQVAGVRTVIMSLWAVEDRAARDWMEALYRARLRDRLDTADAVRQASLAVIHQRRASRQSTHPFYWASFVAAGDWR
jgi:CHAT domain-containing protein